MSGGATLGRVAEPGAWRAEGACASADDPEAWFAGADEPGKTAETARRQEAAVEVCRGCPVLDECLDYALGANERFGIWGGLLPSQSARGRHREPAGAGPADPRADPGGGDLMICLIVAAACWLPPIPLQPLPPPPPLVRSELQEHGWRLPALEVVAPAPPPPAPSPPARGPVPAPPLPAGGVEQWRTLVTQWFGARVDAALSVIDCESGGNPSAVNGRSGAAGLFQHLPRYWPERSSAAGFAGADILDAEANVAVAAWLSDGGTNWTHWECSPS